MWMKPSCQIRIDNIIDTFWDFVEHPNIYNRYSTSDVSAISNRQVNGRFINVQPELRGEHLSGTNQCINVIISKTTNGFERIALFIWFSFTVKASIYAFSSSIVTAHLIQLVQSPDLSPIERVIWERTLRIH